MTFFLQVTSITLIYVKHFQKKFQYKKLKLKSMSLVGLKTEPENNAKCTASKKYAENTSSLVNDTISIAIQTLLAKLVQNEELRTDIA